MSFDRMKERPDFVSRLPDRPQASEGYSPQALKAVFDRGALALRAYLNEDLLCQLEAKGEGVSAAERLGSAAIDGLKGNTVHAQIAALKVLADALREDLRLAATGEIPDGSLGEEKLSEELRDRLEKQNGQGLFYKVFSQNGIFEFVAPQKGCYRFRFTGAGGAGTLVNPLGKPTGVYECEGGPGGAHGELLREMAEGDKVTLIVGKGGVPYGGFALGQELSATEYDGNYLSNRLDSFPGGDTELIFPDGERLVAMGGDRAAGPVGVRSYHLKSILSVSRRSVPVNPFGGQWLSCGADSSAGQGGRNGEAPGIGGGGEGGRLRFEEDARYVVEALPASGADGAVVIDYIGGTE